MTQADLIERESANDLLGLTNSYGNWEGDYYEGGYGSLYNNILLYDSKNESSELLFDFRVSIDEYFLQRDGGKNYLLITGCSKDSNQDGYLNRKDLQQLFMYEFDEKEVTRIATPEHYTLLGMQRPNMSDILVVQFGVDRNEDGVFIYSQEPMIYNIVDFKQKRLREIVSKEQIQKIQRLLEGG